MFKRDDLNMRDIYRHHINTDMNYESIMKWIAEGAGFDQFIIE